MNSRHSSNKLWLRVRGFTLIELLVVIAIIAILGSGTAANPKGMWTITAGD